MLTYAITLGSGTVRTTCKETGRSELWDGSQGSSSTYLSFLAQTRQVYTDPFPIPPPLPQQSIVPAVPIENVIQLELVNFPVSQTLQKSLINKEDIFLKVEDTF